MSELDLWDESDSTDEEAINPEDLELDDNSRPLSKAPEHQDEVHTDRPDESDISGLGEEDSDDDSLINDIPNDDDDDDDDGGLISQDSDDIDLESEETDEDEREERILYAEFQAGLEETFEILDYLEEDRGVPGDASTNGSPCSGGLLEAILHNLMVLQRILACEVEKENDFESAERFAETIMSELERLHGHPDLFQSKDTEEEFWQHVYSVCDNAVQNVIKRQKIHDTLVENLHSISTADELDLHLPVRDRQRKPWEQYLHNRAPGVGADLSAQGEGGSIQIFPMAAVRIVMGWVDENRAIISDIESQRGDGTLYQENPMAGLYANREKRSPDGNIRSHQATTLPQPVAAGSRDALRHHQPTNVETLNQDYAALTRQMRGPAGPRHWNCIGVIIRDRPGVNVGVHHAEL